MTVCSGQTVKLTDCSDCGSVPLEGLDGHLVHQGVHERALGRLRAGLHDVGRARGHGQARGVPEGHAPLLGKRERRHHGVAGAHGGAHLHLGGAGAERLVPVHHDGARTAHGDDHAPHPPRDEGACLGHDVRLARELPAAEARELRVVGLHQVRARVKAAGEGVAVRVEEDLRARGGAGPRPCRVGGHGSALGEAPGEDDDVTLDELLGQLFAHGVELSDRRQRPGLVDVRVRVELRVDDLEVGARLAGRLERPDVDALGLEHARDLLAHRAAQKGDGATLPAELGDHLGDVDALAARVLADVRDAVHLVKREAVDARRLVERGVERDGVDHGPLLSLCYWFASESVETKVNCHHNDSHLPVNPKVKIARRTPFSD